MLSKMQIKINEMYGNNEYIPYIDDDNEYLDEEFMMWMAIMGLDEMLDYYGALIPGDGPHDHGRHHSRQYS